MDNFFLAFPLLTSPHNLITLFAVQAGGEFSVLNSPKGISFKGSEALESSSVGDVLYASLGNAVIGDSNWNGLNIDDPFTLAKGVIVVHVEGTGHVTTADPAKTYKLVGSGIGASLNGLVAELKASDEPVCDINFAEYDDGVKAWKSCFGDDVVVNPADDVNYLTPELHLADKLFLDQIRYINAAAANLGNMAKPSNVLLVRVSLEGVVKAHGKKSQALDEANKMLSTAIKSLLFAARKSSDAVLFVCTSEQEPSVSRTKRDALGASDKNPFNLAEEYNSDYPVIFNIILWFMVVFGLSLLAICYAIAAMDPGRDSIIYRMTSTRIKKDN
ncbi:hypothetical protein KR018_006653 [Drosophila ironensis]|nr:hypothetical protein KR018_006653 [Drosophila ironensis]